MFYKQKGLIFNTMKTVKTYPHRIAKVISWFIISRKNRHHFLEKHDRREIKKRLECKHLESNISE
ncbi:MAG TPA: hypothetical protein DDY68_01970 [Porphyromonadaceae bacterium]|nr:hypothetical protein [Porphyromonadaceae bacterium]